MWLQSGFTAEVGMLCLYLRGGMMFDFWLLTKRRAEGCMMCCLKSDTPHWSPTLVFFWWFTTGLVSSKTLSWPLEGPLRYFSGCSLHRPWQFTKDSAVQVPKICMHMELCYGIFLRSVMFVCTLSHCIVSFAFTWKPYMNVLRRVWWSLWCIQTWKTT